MPARSISKPMTCPEMKNAAIVVTAQTAIEIISARRSASRCSITDMRCSSTGAVARGPRRSTLFSRATRRASVLGGLGLRARGLSVVGGRGWRRCRRAHRDGRWPRRRGCGGLSGVGDFVCELAGGLAELTHRLAHGAPKLGKPAWPEDDEHDQ